MKTIRFQEALKEVAPKCLGPDRRHYKKIQSNKYSAFNITSKRFCLMQSEGMLHFLLKC